MVEFPALTPLPLRSRIELHLARDLLGGFFRKTSEASVRTRGIRGAVKC